MISRSRSTAKHETAKTL